MSQSQVQSENRSNPTPPLNLSVIKSIAHQCLVALSLMKLPGIQIIHCDLKPENIMLCSPESLAVKIIDFGLSCKTTRKQSCNIQSGYYRAPEIIMGIQTYSHPIDMWSMGCILFEMYFGRPLFQNAASAGSEETEVRSLIENVCKVKGELIPQCMIQLVSKPARRQFYESLNMDLFPTMPRPAPRFEDILAYNMINSKYDQKYAQIFTNCSPAQ